MYFFDKCDKMNFTMKTIDKKIIFKLFVLAVGGLFMALATNLFYVPKHLLNGGITGFGMLTYYVFGIPIGVTTIALNIPLFIFAYRQFSREYVLFSGYTMLVSSIATDLIGKYVQGMPVLLQDTLLSCIAGGVLSGLGGALVFRMNSTSGGSDIISSAVNRRFAIPMATTNFGINLIVVFLGSFVGGFEPALYTLVAFFISAKACNAFVIGFDFKKSIMVVSDHADEIAQAIIQIVGRGVTFFNAEGAYTHQHRKVIMVVARLTQTAQIMNIVKEIDPTAFMTMHDINDVYGKGFTLKGSKD